MARPSKLKDAYVIPWEEGTWGVYVVFDDARKHGYMVGTKRQAEKELLSFEERSRRDAKK
jgi:hypothetical protein